jgi:hypothetical protein
MNNRNFFYIYLFLYLSFLVGCYLNEDFAGGALMDYAHHTQRMNVMQKDIIGTFLNYNEETTSHSPVYILYFLFLNNVFGIVGAKLINMHFILLIPFFIYLTLNLRFDLKKNSSLILVPAIFFVSPYFRAGAFTIDDNVLALTLLTISIYFFFRYENSNELKFLFFNTLFLSLAAYFRPIYCFFGFYFFISYYFKLGLNKSFFYYIFFNIILSAPALYYTIILDVNDWFQRYYSRVNILTCVSITLSIIFFYSLPFLFLNISKIQKNKIKLKLFLFNKKVLLLSLIFFFSLFFFFDYSAGSAQLITYSGGIFYKSSILLFKNNYFFYLISSMSFYFISIIFIKFSKKKDLILDVVLLLILIFMGVHGRIYHEIYDPLLYILFFLLIKNNFYKSVIQNIKFIPFMILFLFSLSFFILSIVKKIYLS